MLDSGIPMASSDTGSLSVAVIRSCGSWIHRLGGAAVAGGLLLLAGASSSAKRARRMAVGLLLLLLLLPRRVGATTVSEELASAYAACYDPAGLSCTCTYVINLADKQLSGTIPAQLSACTGVAFLCVCSHAAVPFRPASLSPTHARRRRWLEKAENGRSSRVFFFTVARACRARAGAFARALRTVVPCLRRIRRLHYRVLTSLSLYMRVTDTYRTIR